MEVSSTSVSAGNPATSDYARLLLTSSLVLVLIGVLAFALVWWLRRQQRRGGAHDSDAIRVVAQSSLGPRRDLVIVEVAGRTMLLGVTDGGISDLGPVDAAALNAHMGQQAGRRAWWSALASWSRRGEGSHARPTISPEFSPDNGKPDAAAEAPRD